MVKLCFGKKLKFSQIFTLALDMDVLFSFPLFLQAVPRAVRAAGSDRSVRHSLLGGGPEYGGEMGEEKPAGKREKMLSKELKLGTNLNDKFYDFVFYSFFLIF